VAAFNPRGFHNFSKPNPLKSLAAHPYGNNVDRLQTAVGLPNDLFIAAA
jgi:hypothetical protein